MKKQRITGSPRSGRKVLMLGVVAIGLLAACGGSGDGTVSSDAQVQTSEQEPIATEPITLDYWTWNNEGDYVKVDEDAKARFEAANPNVTVNIVYTPYADYMTKLKATIAAGESPSLFQVPWDSQLHDLARSGTLEPMSGVLASGFPAITDSAKSFVTVDGEVWALPLDLNTLQIAYNKNVFADLGLSAPTSVDDLKAVAKKLKSSGKYGIALGTKDKWAGGDTWYAQVAYTDSSGDLLARADSGDAKWDDPAFLAAADQLADLVKSGVFAPGANSMGAFNESLDLFVSQKAAMFYPVGNFISGGINDKVAGTFDWDLFPFPGKAGQDPVPTGGIARMFALPAGGVKNEVAANFLRVLTDPDGAATLMKYNYIPSWPADVPADATPIYKNFLDAQPKARGRSIFTTSVNVALLDGIQAIFDGGSGKDLISGLVKAKG